MLSKNIASKITKDFFRREHNVYWDLTNGQIGIRKDDGLYTGVVVGEGDDQHIEISQNLLDSLSFKIPAYSIKVSISDIRIGDIIVGESIVGFVEKIKENSLSIRKLNGQLTSDYRPPKVNVQFAGGNIRVIRSLLQFCNTPDQGAGFLSGLQNNPFLMMAILGDKGDESFDKFMPLLLLNGLNGGDQTGGAFGGNMMQTMMMMKMMDGKSDIGDIFDF